MCVLVRVEADNLVKFRRFHHNDNNNDDNDHDDTSEVIFPQPWMYLTSKDVLVESFHEGTHISHYTTSDTTTISASERKQLAQQGLHAFLQMLFEDNFIHADLHPGNILVQPADDNNSSRRHKHKHKLVFLDAGLVTQLNDYDRRSFVQLFQAVIKGQGYKVGRLMIERSRGDQHCDEHAFCSNMEIIVNEVRIKSNLCLF